MSFAFHKEGKGHLPFVSIVIPTKNARGLLENCLESLGQLDYPKDRFEVIIADGLSTDGTADVARSYGAKVVINEKQTVSPGRNVGFEAAKGDLVAFSDADCVMDSDWLQNAVACFADEGLGGVGGPTITSGDESSFGRAVGFVFDLAGTLAGSVHSGRVKPVREVRDIPGCNAIYRRSVLEKVMPVDETLLTGDDVEMNFRITQLGFKLLHVPNVVVWHHRRSTPRGLWRQMYRFAIGRLQVGKRNSQMIRWQHVACGLAIALGLLFGITSFLLSPPLFWAAASAALLALASAPVVAFCKTRSVSISLQVPLVIVMIVIAWSSGFLRELIVPLREVRGK